MEWKRKFGTSFLERGKDYYKKKLVQGLTYNNLVYKARVKGNYTYDVEIKIRNDDIVYMKCSCPYAQKGYYCKHMAAVMFAIEDSKELNKQMELDLKEELVSPFQVSKDTYRYYDMGRIAAELKVEKSKVEKAKKFIKENKIFLESVSIGYHHFIHGSEMCGLAEGFFVDENGHRQISCLFDRTGIIRAECGVWGCHNYYHSSYYELNLCVHQLALLFLIEEYLKKYNPGDTTDPAGKLLLGSFRIQQGLKFIEQQGEDVFDLKIESVLEKENNSLSFSLKVGIDKLYVVKNITEFIQRYDDKDTMRFGTKTEIDFARHRICAQGEAILEFVRRIVKEEQGRLLQLQKSHGYYYNGEEIKQRIPLYGNRLDEFYDLHKDSLVSCTDKNGWKSVKTSYLFQDGKPKISLIIEKDIDEEQIFHGIQVFGKMPDLVQGLMNELV